MKYFDIYLLAWVNNFQPNLNTCMASCVDIVSFSGLACTYFFTFFGRIPKYGLGHETDRRKCYGHKKQQNRRLGDPNPMDDAPDQDSANILEKQV